MSDANQGIGEFSCGTLRTMRESMQFVRSWLGRLYTLTGKTVA